MHSPIFALVAITMVALHTAGCGTSVMDAAISQAPKTQDWMEQLTPIASVDEPSDVDPFQPPYPERTNPFQTAEGSEELSVGQSVQLKGFVALDEPKAVLLVDDVLTVIGEQQSVRGVTVVAVNPPDVTYEHHGIQRRMSLRSTKSRANGL